MSASSSNLAAYSWEEEQFIRCLESASGRVRIALISETTNEAKVKQLRALAQRFNRLRALKRTQSRELYPEDHPSYNRSDYDGIIISLDKDEPALYLLRDAGDYGFVVTEEDLEN